MLLRTSNVKLGIFRHKIAGYGDAHFIGQMDLNIFLDSQCCAAEQIKCIGNDHG